MKKIHNSMLLRAVSEIYLRNKNDGLWISGQVPQVFYGIRDLCFPGYYEDDWLQKVEEEILKQAMKVLNDKNSV